MRRLHFFSLHLSVVLAAAGATSATAQSFQYPDFTDITDLVLNGDAAQSGNFLRVTPSASSQRGSVWYATPVVVDGGFETTFRFRFTAPAVGGADGMVFLVQSDASGATALGDNGGALGYAAAAGSPPGTAIANSLAFELDTWLNGADISNNEISVHSNGTGDNDADEMLSLGQASPTSNMSDGGLHAVRIKYMPGTLEVFVDDLTTPVLSIAYDLITGGMHTNGSPVGGLNLINGSSLYVGFTASTGGAWENHELMSWEWTSDNVIVPYCFGDGSATTCPCGNTGGTGQGCANGTGQGAVASADGTTSVAADDLVFTGDNLLPSEPALLFVGLNAVNGGDGVLFGDGLRCAGGSVVRLGVQVPNATGDATWGPGLGSTGGWLAGDTRRFQVWYRNPGTSPCGFNFNLSNGLEIVFAP